MNQSIVNYSERTVEYCKLLLLSLLGYMVPGLPLTSFPDSNNRSFAINLIHVVMIISILFVICKL